MGEWKLNGHSEMGLGPPANCNQSGPEVVFAQLAGAFYGEAGIPEAWRERVAMRGRIVELADGLV